MKITKRPIKACNEIVLESQPEVVEVAMTAETCPYESSINYIRSAIEELGKIAKDDPIARESIANLSVVLFDLKS